MEPFVEFLESYKLLLFSSENTVCYFKLSHHVVFLHILFDSMIAASFVYMSLCIQVVLGEMALMLFLPVLADDNCEVLNSSSTDPNHLQTNPRPCEAKTIIATRHQEDN